MNGADADERIARAIQYMEAHIGQPFPMEEAAKAACWSLFHFHRMFTARMGLGPSEHLRRRRLARAAEGLALGHDSVRTIAAASGFATAESFGRAFRQTFGLSPSAYRRASTGTRRMNPFGPVERPTFQRPTNLREDPLVVEHKAVRLAALGFACPLEAEAMGPRIEAFWKGPAQRLFMLPERVTGLTYGIATPDRERPGQRIRYLAGVELVPGAPVPPWAEAFDLPEGPCLRALSEGDPARIKDLWLYLYGFWLPRQGLEPGAALDFDVFRSSEPNKAELFLPVQDRKE